MARPMPREAPVTSAVLPVRSLMSISLSALVTRPAVLQGRYEPASLRASAEGVPEGWKIGGRRCGTGIPPGAALRDQAQFPRASDGLGAVCRAEFAQDVADVLFDREHGDEQLLSDGPVRRARGKHRQHLQL